MKKLKIKKLKIIKAFSLIETLITSGICCSILLIGNLQLKQYRNRLVFENTVRQVTTSLDQASRFSTIEKKPVTVLYFDTEHYLNLSGTRLYHKTLVIDPNIKIYGLNKFRFSSNGSSCPGTVTFKGYGLEKKVKYQMLWGRISE